MNMTNTVQTPKIRDRRYIDALPSHVLSRNLMMPGEYNKHFLYLCSAAPTGEQIIFEKYEYELFTKPENVYTIFGMQMLAHKVNGVPLMDAISFKSKNTFFYNCRKVKEASRRFSFVGRIGRYRNSDIVRVDALAAENCHFFISDMLLKLGFDFSNRNGVLIIGVDRVIRIRDWLHNACRIADPMRTIRIVGDEAVSPPKKPKWSRNDWRRSAQSKGISVHV